MGWCAFVKIGYFRFYCSGTRAIYWYKVLSITTDTDGLFSKNTSVSETVTVVMW